ncbi:MAG: hypothetical protein RQ922_02300 [Thermoproteota archaeon]|jgi:hypothetical protein|nr:hypothetical protein [Thermoproteota archaeon]
MKLVYVSIIVYLTLMHLFVFLYIINVIQTAFLYTIITAGIFSYLILIFSFIVLISNLKVKNRRSIILSLAIICLPITLAFYLPVVYYKQIYSLFYPIFPSFTEFFLSISYQPLYFLFIFIPYFTSLISALIVYLYLKFKLKV